VTLGSFVKVIQVYGRGLSFVGFQLLSTLIFCLVLSSKMFSTG